MKSRNKVLSFLIALVMSVGLLNIPTIFNAIANASETLSVSSVLQVKNITDEFDLTADKNKLKYYDYCATSGAEVILWNPDGSVASDNGGNYKSYTNAEYFTFTTPGVYALQYRLLSNGFYVYSEVFYIPVANSISAITYKSELEKEVKAGTIVTIPETNETIFGVKVYTPYGDEVEVSGGKFTNNANILGTYYIEYEKKVSYGGEQVSKFDYITIKFSETSTITNATIVRGDGDITTDYALNVAGNDLYKEKDYLYHYKYYNLADVYVSKPDGTKDDGAVIKVSIYNETKGTYYNFDSGEFITSTKADSERVVSDADVKLTEFILRDEAKFSAIGSTGDTIKITYSAVAGGKTLEKTFSKSEKFNRDAISVKKTENLNTSEYVGLVVDKKIPVNDADLTAEQKQVVSIGFSNVVLEVQEGYDKEAIAGLIKEVNFAATNSLSGKAYRSLDGKSDETGFGVQAVDKGTASKLDDEFVLYFNGKAKSEFYFTCAYSINFKGTSAEFVFSETITWKLYVRAESGDKTKPSGITISNYNSIVMDKIFVIPTVTASDLDDSGNATAGVEYSVSVKGTSTSSYPGLQPVQMGQKLVDLKPGTYTVTYNISDGASNVRVKTINFKVIKEDKDASFLALSVMNVSSDETSDDYYRITSQTNANYVFAYKEGEMAFSPKTEIVGGTVNAVELGYASGEDVVVVYALKNYYGTSYVAAKVSGVVETIVPNSMGVNAENSEYVALKVNALNKLKVNDAAIWFGSDSFEIEAELNEDEKLDGLYYISDGNEIVFLEAGTYTIISNENKAGEYYKSETTVVVTDNVGGFEIDMPVGQKQVAKKGTNVDVRVPVVKNYFGYSLEIYVEDSKGNYIAQTIDGVLPTEFTASNAEGYRINYKLSSDDISTSIKSSSVSAGVSIAPTITIAGGNENVEWTGETIKYVIKGATAVDKYGNSANVNIYCFDPTGKELLVKTDEVGNKYVEVKEAGVYSIYYTSTDVDGYEAISRTNFVVEFPEVEEKETINPWKVVGIIFGSLVAAGVIALAIIYFIKKDKKKKRFINKNKQAKKKEKIEQTSGMVIYTIAESKDEKHWTIKRDNKQIAKVASKVEAIEKVKSMDKNSNAIIKVYNKNGRLIDSL